MEDQGEQGSPEDEDMPGTSGASMTEQAEVQRSRSERYPSDEMEMVGDTEMMQTFRKWSVDRMQMYSPPRVTEDAKKFGLRTGAALDTTTGSDFRRSDHRRRAKEDQKEHKPLVIFGRPVCEYLTTSQTVVY